MGDYWLTQLVLGAIGWGYVIVSVLGMLLALWLPKSKWGKGIVLACVAVFIGLPIRSMVIEQQELKAKKADYDKRYAVANAIFEERCKTAGEKIYKTVPLGEKVDGLLLLKIPDGKRDYTDQYEPRAAHQAYSGWGYARSFVSSGFTDQKRPKKLSETAFAAYWPVFEYVEYVDPKDGVRYRHRRGMDNNDPREVSPNREAPRYAADYELIAVPEDRPHWIAHAKYKVIDTKDSSLMAEYHMVKFHRGLGRRAGGSTPWSYAEQCPEIYSFPYDLPRQLAIRVLKPLRIGEKK